MADARETEILEMHKAGLSRTQIAQEIGTSTMVITHVLEAHGIKVTQKPVIDKGTEQLIIEAYQDGLSIAEVRSEFGVSVTKLYGILADNDIPTRSVQVKVTRDRQMEEAIQMYKDGYPLKDIFRDTGIHQPTLHQELALREIPLRRPRGGSNGNN